MSRLFQTLVLLFIVVASSYSQVDFIAVEKDLAYHADIMVNVTVEDHRFKAADLFREQFEVMLNTPDSYDHEFESLKWISKLVAADNSFRIFSWIVADADVVSKTYGYIQFADGRVVKLNDTGEMNTDLEYEQTDADNWFGALYYNIMPATSDSSSTDYILMGYRQIAKFDKVKVLEVLSVNDGEITFGKELFLKEVEGSRDQGPTQLPDGSFVGYKLEGDQWKYVDKLFNQTSATAPRPQPVLGNDKDKDIFGGSKTKKKKKRN